MLYAYALAYLVAPDIFDSAHIIQFVGGLPEYLKYAGKVALAGPFAFHTLNGIRHLSWDAGKREFVLSPNILQFNQRLSCSPFSQGFIHSRLYCHRSICTSHCRPCVDVDHLPLLAVHILMDTPPHCVCLNTIKSYKNATGFDVQCWVSTCRRYRAIRL